MRERPRTLIALNAVLLTLALGFLAYTIVHAVATVVHPLGPFVDWRTYENATTRLLSGGATEPDARTREDAPPMTA